MLSSVIWILLGRFFAGQGARRGYGGEGILRPEVITLGAARGRSLRQLSIWRWFSPEAFS